MVAVYPSPRKNSGLIRNVCIGLLALCLFSTSACDADPNESTPGTQAPGATPSLASTFDPPLAFGEGVVLPGKTEAYTVSGTSVYYVQHDALHSAPPALVAWDLPTGGARWTVAIAETGVRQWSWRPGVATADGTELVAVAIRLELKGSGTQADHDKLRVTMFSGNDGKELWSKDLDAQAILGAGSLKFKMADDPVVVGVDGNRVAVVIDKRTLAFDSRSGELAWTEAAFQATVLKGGVVIGEKDRASTWPYSRRVILAKSAMDGKDLWTYPPAQPDNGDIPHFELLRMSGDYVGIRGPRGIKFGQEGEWKTHIADAATGTIRFTLPHGYGCAFDQRDTIVCRTSDFYTLDNAMVGIDTATWKILWRLPEENRVVPTLQTTFHGAVYAETSSGPVILDARTGKDKATSLRILPDVVIPGFGIDMDAGRIRSWLAVG